jgi:hypothetical protein
MPLGKYLSVEKKVFGTIPVENNLFVFEGMFL